MAHTRAARYLRKRLRNLLRRFTPCCVRTHEHVDGSCHRDGSDEALLSREISDSCPSKGEDVSKTTAVAWEPSSREQLLASFVSNYVKEVIFNARVKLYIEDMIIKGSLAIIGSMLPDNGDKIS